MTDDFAELEAQIAALQQNNRWKKEDAKQATVGRLVVEAPEKNAGDASAERSRFATLEVWEVEAELAEAFDTSALLQHEEITSFDKVRVGEAFSSDAMDDFKNFMATIIQSQIRGWLQQREYRRMHQAASKVQRRFRFYFRHKDFIKRYEYRMARRIQRAWRGHRDSRIYSFYRDIITSKQRTDPVQVLRCINPREAQLLEAGSGLVVRFRLGGATFPPLIYYKIFTKNPVVDINAFAPRNYAQEDESELRAREAAHQRVRHEATQVKGYEGDAAYSTCTVGMALRERAGAQERGTLRAGDGAGSKEPPPSTSAFGGAEMGSTGPAHVTVPRAARAPVNEGEFLLEEVLVEYIKPDGSVGRRPAVGWYHRGGCNGWRAVSDRAVILDEPVAEAKAARRVFQPIPQLRREERVRRIRERRLEWLRRAFGMAKEGRALDNASGDASENIRGAPASMSGVVEDAVYAHSVGASLGTVDEEVDALLEGDDDALLRWTDALDYEGYLETWEGMASTEVAGEWLLEARTARPHTSELLAGGPEVELGMRELLSGLQSRDAHGAMMGESGLRLMREALAAGVDGGWGDPQGPGSAPRVAGGAGGAEVEVAEAEAAQTGPSVRGELGVVPNEAAEVAQEPLAADRSLGDMMRGSVVAPHRATPPQVQQPLRVEGSEEGAGPAQRFESQSESWGAWRRAGSHVGASVSGKGDGGQAKPRLAAVVAAASVAPWWGPQMSLSRMPGTAEPLEPDDLTVMTVRSTKGDVVRITGTRERRHEGEASLIAGTDAIQKANAALSKRSSPVGKRGGSPVRGAAGPAPEASQKSAASKDSAQGRSKPGAERSAVSKFSSTASLEQVDEQVVGPWAGTQGEP